MSNRFENFNHLGFINPLVIKKQDTFKIESNLESIIKDSVKQIDVTAIAQILNFGYSLGDRTLITDIKKTPWMAKPNKAQNNWNYFQLPTHQELDTQNDTIFKELFQRLKNEVKVYIENKKNIGFLLTGGMDSRIVASVLINVIREDNLGNININTYTWGDSQSRDIIYAKRISELYNWHWKHIKIDQQQLERNVEIIVDQGCEFSPIHLHGMSRISELEHLDCIIAGSFGDSIGRGEYSGVKVLNIKPIEKGFTNPLAILNESILGKAIKNTKLDVESYHKIFPQDKKYQQLEQDYQLHYMRKMLTPCFTIINKRTPVYQMFSSPEVYGYMWSQHPSLRTDEVYYNILKNFSPELLEIPWARTGLPFPNKNGNPDKFNNKTIDYGKLIRANFLDKIEKTLIDGTLVKSNLLSEKKIKKTIRLIKNFPIKESYYFEDKLIWLYSLQLFINKNKIKLEQHAPSFNGDFNLYKEYFLRKLFYRHRKKIKTTLNRLKNEKKNINSYLKHGKRWSREIY